MFVVIDNQISISAAVKNTKDLINPQQDVFGVIAGVEEEGSDEETNR